MKRLLTGVAVCAVLPFQRLPGHSNSAPVEIQWACQDLIPEGRG
jgi:hypothetical protein